MTKQEQRRWPWWNQTVDLALALAGLTVIGAMVVKWSFPWPGIVLAMSCVGGLTSNQIASILISRYTGSGDK